MKQTLVKEEKFSFLEVGEGQPIILLHGLMGGLSNFQGILNFFPHKGYRVIIPELPVYTLPLVKTSVRSLSEYVYDFLQHKGFSNSILVGNSLGGHVGLLFTKNHPELVKALVLTGSSGLYENNMGDGYPKRGDYEYIKAKSEAVFYDPKIATKEIVDEVFKSVNDRNKLVRTLALAKSAIRHNMAKDLPHMNTPTALLWGSQDSVTPPNVAEEFERLLPDAELFWIDKCGHAPMMEHPDLFNEILLAWLLKRNL
ncbi:MAG: alpha/beta hydrolase [Flavobacteriaceae bacterium]|jgi:pimeloyl-ACP methyl ester carboxylesterase